jgi:hypothetical protein
LHRVLGRRDLYTDLYTPLQLRRREDVEKAAPEDRVAMFCRVEVAAQLRVEVGAARCTP